MAGVIRHSLREASLDGLLLGGRVEHVVDVDVEQQKMGRFISAIYASTMAEVDLLFEQQNPFLVAFGASDHKRQAHKLLVVDSAHRRPRYVCLRVAEHPL